MKISSVPQKKLLKALDLERQKALRPGYLREETDQLVRHIPVQAGLSGLVTWSKIPASQQESVVHTQQTVFAERGLMLRWQSFEHDRPKALDVELLNAGFHGQAMQAFWVAPSAEIAQLALTQEHALMKVQDLNLLKQLRGVLKEVWGQYDAHRRYDRLRQLLSSAPDYCEVIAALDSPDHLISCAWSYYPPDSPFAYLAGSTVLPEMQNQGVYRHMLRLRAERAQQQGRDWLAVMIRPESESLLRRLGFIRLSSRQIWSWRPSPMVQEI